jgi:hypothetical protein
MSKYLIVMLLAVRLLLAEAVSAAVSASVAKDVVSFEAELPRTVYVVGEPIIATFAVANVSKVTQHLADPTVTCNIVSFEVVRLGAEATMLPHVEATYAEPSDDAAWDFLPGEARSISVDLLEQYPSLPEGKYELRASYCGPDGVRGVWHGNVVVSGLRFSVELPGEDEAEAARAFSEARSHLGRQITPEVFASLEQQAVGKRFAQYAGYWRARAHGEAKNYGKAIQAARDYLVHHPNVPCYSSDAREWLSFWLYLNGDLAAAKGELLKMKDSFGRRIRLRRITARQ